MINLSFEVWLIFFCSIARKVVLHKNGKSNNPVYKNRRMYCTSLHDNSILGPSLGSCLCNKNLHQQGKSVAKYIFFLSNLLNTIGWGGGGAIPLAWTFFYVCQKFTIPSQSHSITPFRTTKVSHLSNDNAHYKYPSIQSNTTVPGKTRLFSGLNEHRRIDLNEWRNKQGQVWIWK